MRHETVRVKRDELTVHHLSVAPWEIGILEHLYDEGNVTRTGKFVDLPDREYPDPKEEVTRLAKVYGADSETKETHVSIVYGATRAGIKALGVAIDAAREDEHEAKPKRKRRSIAQRPSYGDALLA